MFGRYSCQSLYAEINFWSIGKTALGGGRRRIFFMKIVFRHNFEEIISIENILEAWKEFVKGKRNKKDVREFYSGLMDNILELHSDLENQIYQHGGYKAFRINDPKPRSIHKASVRDRLLHRAVYRVLYLFFDKIFISDSFSCRNDKGTHKALNRFRSFTYKVSKNNTKTCWVLKCDIRKFFENINHDILLEILNKYIPDKNIIWLFEKIIRGFSSKPNTGLPLGNLTSQLLVNIYMNEFDQFVRHKLKVKYYIRYADDFVVMSGNRDWLERQIEPIKGFLSDKLELKIHPDKIFLKTLASGIDFLGWVYFLDHRILRTTTRKRMLRRLRESQTSETLNSYLGLLKHGNTKKLEKMVLERAIM